MFRSLALLLVAGLSGGPAGAAERVQLTDKQLDRVVAGDMTGSMVVNGVLVSWALTGVTTSVSFGSDGSVMVSASTP